MLDTVRCAATISTTLHRHKTSTTADPPCTCGEDGRLIQAGVDNSSRDARGTRPAARRWRLLAALSAGTARRGYARRRHIRYNGTDNAISPDSRSCSRRARVGRLSSELAVKPALDRIDWWRHPADDTIAGRNRRGSRNRVGAGWVTNGILVSPARRCAVSVTTSRRDRHSSDRSRDPSRPQADGGVPPGRLDPAALRLLRRRSGKDPLVHSRTSRVSPAQSLRTRDIPLERAAEARRVSMRFVRLRFTRDRARLGREASSMCAGRCPGPSFSCR